MRPFLPALAAATACICTMSASAFTIVPADDESGRIAVVVERDYGDVVSLSALPKPYDSLIQESQGPDTLSFRWSYFRSDEEGTAYIHVDGDGNGLVSIEFLDPQPSIGDRLGAALVLLDEDDTPRRSLLVRADVERGRDGEAISRYLVEMPLKRPLDWWRQVESVAFLTMKYYRQQAPDDQGVWDAMQRAVDRFTDGRGTRQRAMARQSRSFQNDVRD